MRKKQTAIFSSILFCLILICGSLELISCSNNSAQETEISFSIPSKVIRQVISRASEKDESIRISVKLFDSNEEKEIKLYEESKSIDEWELFLNEQLRSEDGYKVTFPEVPLAITVYAEVSIYLDFEVKIKEIYHGRSEVREVQAGENPLSVVLEEVAEQIQTEGSITSNLDYTPFTIEIDKDEIFVGGDVITLSAIDQEENLLSDVNYSVKLMYKGNSLDADYYTVSDSLVTISELDLTGNYNLFVIATYLKNGVLPVIASQTFELNAFMPTELYVSADGNDSNKGLSEQDALASLKKASNLITTLSLKTEEKINWTINLKGEFSTPQILQPVGAGDILLRGTSELDNGVPRDIINANANEANRAAALTIETKSKVSIENLKLTGGYNYQGGGINCASGDLVIGEGVIVSGNYAASYGGGVYTSRSLYMSGGVICDNEAGENGGGVYVYGNLFIYGDAVIGNKDATGPADAEHYSNKAAAEGGGVDCSGTVYLGYSGKDEDYELIPASITGGIYYNYSSGIGGGIACSVDMNGGSISYNAAAENGNGVYLNQYGDLFMGGDAVLKGNDIYLSRERNEYSSPAYYEASIKIKSALTSEEEIVATITPQDYNYNVQVLYVDENSGLNISDLNTRFAVTSEVRDGVDSPIAWDVSEYGFLHEID